MNSFRAAILIGIIGVFILITGYISLYGITPVHITSDFYANFGSEMLGIAITVLVIDYLNMRREEKELKSQLVRDLGSENNLFALRAIRELRAHGSSQGDWLTDGTLHHTVLLGANLANAPLEGASLIGVDLTGSVLHSAFMADAKFENAILKFADLSHANLQNANLRSADLFGATLRKVNLRGCDFSGANLKDAIIDDIFYDNSTKWPNDFDLSKIT